MEENNFNQKQTKSIGPIIGIAIIVVLIIFGGLYYWGAQISKRDIPNDSQDTIVTTIEEIENTPDATLEQLQTQSTSDEIADIEADLNLTDLENLDTELGDIDTELGL